MRHIRQQRKILAPLKKVIGKPGVFTPTGNKAFKRTRKKKFEALVNVLRDDEFQSFCAAIGFIEINWALFESQLDNWVQIFYNNLGGKKIAKKMPVSFANKIDFARKCASSEPKLIMFRARISTILDIAEVIAVTRHDVTHSVVENIEPIDGGFSMVNRKLLSNGTHTMKSLLFEAKNFPKLSKDLLHLGREAILISGDLADAFL